MFLLWAESQERWAHPFPIEINGRSKHFFWFAPYASWILAGEDIVSIGMQILFITVPVACHLN